MTWSGRVLGHRHRASLVQKAVPRRPTPAAAVGAVTAPPPRWDRWARSHAPQLPEGGQRVPPRPLCHEAQDFLSGVHCVVAVTVSVCPPAHRWQGWPPQSGACREGGEPSRGFPSVWQPGGGSGAGLAGPGRAATRLFISGKSDRELRSTRPSHSPWAAPGARGQRRAREVLSQIPPREAKCGCLLSATGTISKLSPSFSLDPLPSCRQGQRAGDSSL